LIILSVVDEQTMTQRMQSHLIWCALLLAWILVLCFVPDPRPLAAPGWAIGAVRSLAGLQEASARMVTTLGLRVAGVVTLGGLLMLALGGQRWTWRSAALIALAPVLAVAATWINHGYFPIRQQIVVAVVGAAIGAVAGLALRRNLTAAIAAIVLAGGLFAWGVPKGVSDDLDVAARAVGRHVLAEAAGVPDGDAGFVRLIEIAFAFAEDNAHGSDPVLPNRAAVLALGVILGEEKVAGVAWRHIDEALLPQAEALRARISLHGRKDWSRHFWVSAALTLLSDADRSIAIGIAKELMDAQAGGTGFSFADLTADAAGNRFALAATRDADAARAMQARALGGLRVTDVFPDVHDLPENLSRDAFQEQFGGLGGEGTKRVVADIQRRLDGCAALR
jgi:hypothetical protein